jgi:hypothetical protein
VVIDNHPNAWPQSGLDKASVVFEALAEGGITRFMAVFQDGALPDAAEIGPVRSARIYFVEWAMGLQGVFMHAGGSPDGLALAQSTDRLINAEALALPRQYAWREGRRAAPHNLYTNSAALRSFVNDRDQSTPDDPQLGYLFDHVPPAEQVQATVISYGFTDPTFRATWRYDAASNSYYRSMRDKPHVDRVTGQQLATRNVVVMEVSNTPRPGDNKGRLDINVVGSGAARIFFAGRQIDATWRKDDAVAPLRFYDAQGQEIVFNAGPIWIAAVSSFDKLSVQ